MIRLLLSLVLLTLIYVFVLVSYNPWDILMGLLFSGALLYAFRDFLFGGRPAPVSQFLGRVAALPLFLVMALWDILQGTWEVLTIVLHLRPLAHPGIVAVPIGDRTPVGVAVSGLETTLSPGTYLVDVDWERGVWLMHAINASDPDGLREDRRMFYERYQRRVFP